MIFVSFFISVTGGFGGPSSAGTSFIFGWHSNQAVLFANTFSNNAHTAQVNALKLINSTHLASGSDDKTIKIWDFTTLKCTSTLNTPNNETVLSLALLKNNFLASGCDGANKIFIWNLDFAGLVATLDGHTAKVNTLEVLNDGILASGGADSTVRLWNSGDYTLLYTYPTTAVVNCIKQLANGYLAIALNVGPNNLVIWDPLSKGVIKTYGPHSSAVRAVEELNNGYFATGAESGNVRLWIENNINTAINAFSHTKKIKALKSLTNGILVSASDDNTIKIWNSTSLTLVSDLIYPFDINYNALEVGKE
jgi:WD40 repeat protein